MVRFHQNLRRQVFYKLFRKVDHGTAEAWSDFSVSRFHGICLWRNERQRTLASRYATAMGPMRYTITLDHREILMNWFNDREHAREPCTTEEHNALSHGTCPDCRATDSLTDISMNTVCTACGAEFIARGSFGTDRMSPKGQPRVEKLKNLYGIVLEPHET